jgi:two-component system sensor histidine kinase PilS (NtrC family)
MRRHPQRHDDGRLCWLATDSIIAYNVLMKFTGEIEEWLPWVIKIRFVIISFVFAIEYAIRTLAGDLSGSASIKYFGIVIILWYIVSLFFLIYNQLSRDYQLQAYLQIYCDIILTTAVVHLTGDLDSNYLSLYLVAIILASFLLQRARVFLVAAVSFIFMGALLELAYLPSIYGELVARYPAFGFLATSSTLQVDLRTLQVKIGASLFGFFAVAYLSSYLAESLRKAGEELGDKSRQVASLQAKNENIILSMRDGLLSTELDRTISELNPAGAEILGRRAGELKGEPVDAILPGVQLEKSSTFEAMLAPSRQEVLYRHPEKGERILGVLVSPLTVPGVGVAGYVYSFQDLTEEKRREAEYHARDRMARLGRMAAGIAHEIRNPLASIAGSVKLLQSIARLDEDQGKLIAIVSRESERLNKLVSDFLLYSRDQRFDFQPVDVVNLLEETILLLRQHPLFGPRCRVERKLPRHAVVISADADKLRQVFWNICDNALKAMPNGGTVTVQVEEIENGAVRVILGDTGVGFTSAQLENLFEPFQSGFSGGTGLGLPIVYQIIEAHQGAIKADSKPGKGTRFLIELPKTRVPAPSVSSPPVQPVGTPH